MHFYQTKIFLTRSIRCPHEHPFRSARQLFKYVFTANTETIADSFRLILVCYGKLPRKAICVNFIKLTDRFLYDVTPHDSRKHQKLPTFEQLLFCVCSRAAIMWRVCVCVYIHGFAQHKCHWNKKLRAVMYLRGFEIEL